MKTMSDIVSSIEEVGVDNIDYMIILQKGKYELGDVINIGKYNMEIVEKKYKIVIA